MNPLFDREILREHAFGLVEAAMVEHLSEALITEPLVPSILAASAHLMPRVINLQAPGQLDALLHSQDSTRAFGHAPQVRLFIKTKINVSEFAHSWNSIQLVAPAPERKLWLRLHDPRVLHQMLRILKPLQIRKLFGRFQTLTYWVGDEWVSADPEALWTNRRAETGWDGPLVGDRKWDWPRIERIGIVNRVLYRAGICRAAALTRQAALAEQLIERAIERHGLVSPSDQIEFAIRGMTTCSTFDDHPDVAQFVKPSPDRADESTLTDRLALVDEHVWAGLREMIAIH